MNAKQIIDAYISFFEKREHIRIANSPLIPDNDPTTLFTSSGMQPLVPYLLGETHPSGVRLVNVQNSFRAQDIEEIGDNRHTTFFRMLGNWSLGDYFKKEEIPWLWEFLTVTLQLPKEKLYITVFAGDENVEKDNESFEIWKTLVPEDKIFFAGVEKNWWSRSGVPSNMPLGEPGGPDTEVYFKFDNLEHNTDCKDNPVECECGVYLEIANSVFMQYLKTANGFENLPKQNVDFGGGLERLIAATENKSDIFQTSLFLPIIKSLEEKTGINYSQNPKELRIITDHLRAAIYLINAGVIPSNKERGYILRRLIRRAADHLKDLELTKLEEIIEVIVAECSKTDEILKENYETIKNAILEEYTKYYKTLSEGKKLIQKELIIAGIKVGDEIMNGKIEIPASIAFKGTATLGIGPVQFENLGYTFNRQEYANLMESHKNLSRTASAGMFKGGLADHNEKTIMGHTATHLLHQALRDLFGTSLHQTGSNITTERLRFDFNKETMLTEDELKKVEEIVNVKIKENLPVHFEMLPLQKAKEIGAIGLFDEKYAQDVKVYFIGEYSKEFCGGPHVDFTGKIKSFKIIKQENLGKGQKRIYATVGD